MKKWVMGEGERSMQRKQRFSLRIPIRWRWTMLVGFALAAAVAIFLFVILEMERDAWLDSQASQAELQVDRLSDELKLPMLSGSSAETDLVVQGFISKVPTVMGVMLKFADGSVKTYDDITGNDGLLAHVKISDRVQRLPVAQLWYAKSVVYAKTDLGMVAVRFSETEWEHMSSQLVKQISIAALLVILVSMVLVYWLAGHMSQRIEVLAHGALRVGEGDYQVVLPVRGNDEISDAISQFNMMAQELAHKESLRDVFGRYLNPELISGVFEHGGSVEPESRRQEVSVLFADMVEFTSFSEATDTELVVSVLNSHFEVFHRIIAYYGGHVDKYIGDAVMAVFNHPITDEDHARHAAKAGLAIAIACEKLAMKHVDGSTISFRVGLNCGQAIVGNIGAAKRLEYTVIGDAVNVASRMSGMGGRGSLVMPRETFLKLGDGFAFESIGASKVKGIQQEIEVGIVHVADKGVHRNLEHVVDMAFNLDLSTDVRQVMAYA